jgi:hypothetical protein
MLSEERKLKSAERWRCGVSARRKLKSVETRMKRFV